MTPGKPHARPGNPALRFPEQHDRGKPQQIPRDALADAGCDGRSGGRVGVGAVADVGLPGIGDDPGNVMFKGGTKGKTGRPGR